MTAGNIPVYDIGQISRQEGNQDLLIERLDTYLLKHYDHLHRPHRHSFYHFVLFTKGKGHHSIDFIKYPVKPFDLYFMAPAQVHGWNFEGSTEGYIIHFSSTFFTSFLQSGVYLERFGFFDGAGGDPICPVPVAIRPEVLALLESLLKETERSDRQSADMIRVKLLTLFLLLERSRGGSTSKKIPPQKHLLLRNFRQLIEHHFRDIRLPKEYADLLYITPNHLNALCRDLLGKTAGELIRDRILLEAKRLLTNASMTITELAYELNFQDNSYFNRFFRKYTGVTPEEFRRAFIEP